jgi:outer membrane lipoprotein SlyB
MSTLTKKMILAVAVLSAICVTSCNTTKTASSSTNDSSIAPSERGKVSNYNRTQNNSKPQKGEKNNK